MAEDKVDIEKIYQEYMAHFQKLLEELPMPVIAEAGEMEEVMLPASDGVKLRTWFFFPKGIEGPFPTVAVRCCYDNQAEMLKSKAAAFNKRGFGFAVQWCRGTGGSEGEWVPNINERADGLSFMETLSDDERVKNIGYWGDSYLALTGWCMADAIPDKVKTMYLGVYGCFRHVSAYKDGMFRQDILTDWAMNNAGQPIDADYLESAAYRPQVEVDEKLWGVKLPWYRDWITHTDRDDPYWDKGFWGDLKEIPSKVKIPVYVKEGWYDHHLGSAIRTWEALSEDVKAKSVFEIGPWNHAYMPCIDHQSTDNLIDDSIASPLLWFDKILRKGEESEGTVRLYQVGADKWDIQKVFPTPMENEKRLYLDASQNKTLSEYQVKEETNQTFIYDPENPVHSNGAESTFHSMMQNGSHIQPDADYRDDILSFVSDELTEDLHVNGAITVNLAVSSDVEDTSFTAKVMEVFEDGTAYNVRGSITTLGYRNDTPHRIEYTPGEKVTITIKMWDIDWKFKKGSKIRLDVGSSDFPQYSIHTNNAGVWSLQETTKKAKQTIYCGGEDGSYIVMPIQK